MIDKDRLEQISIGVLREPMTVGEEKEMARELLALRQEVKDWRENAAEFSKVNLLKHNLSKDGEYVIVNKDYKNGATLSIGDALILGQTMEDLDKALEQYNALVEKYSKEGEK